MRPGSRTLELTIVPRGRAARPLPPRLALGAGHGREAPAAGRPRDDGDRAVARAGRARARADGARPRAGSFYELLRDRYGITIAGGVQTIEPTVTNEEESAALGVPLHSPAFLFERSSRDEAARDRGVRPVDVPRRPLPDRLDLGRTAAAPEPVVRPAHRRPATFLRRWSRPLGPTGNWS